MDWREVIYPSSMRLNKDYSFYYLGMAKILVLGGLPLFSLIYLNIKIYAAVKFSAELLSNKNSRQRRRDQDLARVLIGIVIVFLVCHLFRVIIEIDNMFGSEMIEMCYKANKPTFTLWSIIVDPLSEVMMVLNSSVNTMIYCFLNANFRKCILITLGFAKGINAISSRNTQTITSIRTHDFSLNYSRSSVAMGSLLNRDKTLK